MPITSSITKNTDVTIVRCFGELTTESSSLKSSKTMKTYTPISSLIPRIKMRRGKDSEVNGSRKEY